MSKDIETMAQAQETLVQQIESACEKFYEDTVTADEYFELVESAKEQNSKSIQKIIERDILGYGSLHKPQCSLHEKYTSACCGCQKSRAVYHAIEDYKEFISSQAITNALYGENR